MNTPKDFMPRTEIAKARREIQIKTMTTTVLAKELMVTNQQTYGEAGELILTLKSATKAVEEKLDPIIQPIRTGLDSLYELKRELLKPIAEAETALKAKMRDWKMEEMRKEQERLAAIREEQEKLLAEKEEAERRLAAARTAQMREKLAARVVDIEEKAEATFQPPPVTKRVAGGGTRTIRRVAVKDLIAFLRGVISGQIPHDMVTINVSAMQAEHRMNTKMVEGWPGVEAWDDVQIVGRG